MNIKATDVMSLREFAQTLLEHLQSGSSLGDDELAGMARQALGVTEEGRMIADPYQALINLNDALYEATCAKALDAIQTQTQEEHTITDFCDAVTVTLRESQPLQEQVKASPTV